MNIKKKPILFSTEMVQAILKGRKTQTRRILKNPPVEPPYGIYTMEDALPHVNEHGQLLFRWASNVNGREYKNGGSYSWQCPYGAIGTILWVRETFQTTYNENTKKWDYIYKADGVHYFDDDGPTKWKPSLFMPYDACRLFLRITDIKVERLQDISEEDALSEGIINRGPMGFTAYGVDQHRTAKEAFRYLWEKINGPESWNTNPWVWKITFERTEKPVDESTE